MLTQVRNPQHTLSSANLEIPARATGKDSVCQSALKGSTDHFIGVIQDAKFKRRDALADLAKVASKM
jgi:hypothetical protein